MKFLFYVLFLFLLEPAIAATYYVSDLSGQDSYSSTQAQNSATPWKSVNKLNTFGGLKAGDSVLFKKGETFYGTLRMFVTGAAGMPITYSSYGTGANPVLSGFTSVTNWTAYNGNIFYATVAASDVPNVTLDGVIRGLGRYPNTGYLTYTSHTNNSAITGTSVSTLPANFTGGEVVIKKYRYILDRHKITAQSGSTISFGTSTAYGDNTSNPPTDGNGYFVQGHISTLDKEGEWFFDNATQRLYMYFGTGTPAGRTVKASTVNSVAVVNALSYLNFNSLDFEGGNMGFENMGAKYVTMNNCNFRQSTIGIYGNYCTNIAVNGGSISDCTTNGVNIYDQNTNTTINGVTVTRCGSIPGLGMSGDCQYNGILVVGDGTKITNCKVTNIGFNGIYFDGNDILVERNYVDTFCTVKDDGGGIYTFTNPGTVRSNRIVRSNVVVNAIGNAEGAQWNGDNHGEAAAIYLDGFTNHTEVSNNSCAHGPWAGILENANSSNQILNNTTFNFVQGLAITVTSNSGGFGTVRNLLINGNKFVARTADQSTINVSLFVNDNPGQFGTIDNNIYARPISNASPLQVYQWFSGGTGLQNLSLNNWQSAYSLDLNSQKSTVTIASDPDNNIRFEYNATSATKTVVLNEAYLDVNNTQYTGTITLQPFSSLVLIKAPVAVKTNQAINFPAVASQVLGVTPFALNATATSGLPVSVRVVSGSATLSGNIVTVTGTGTVTIEASQAGNTTYNAAAVVTQSFSVTNPIISAPPVIAVTADQTINFSTISSKVFGAAPFALSATSTSGLPVSFTVVSGPATISGNTITINGAGTVAALASQAGNTNYKAAAAVTQSFTVAKAGQTISFTPVPADVKSFALTATATSTLPVTFRIVSGTATLSGNTVTFSGNGTVTIEAAQAGNTNYNAAAAVTQVVNVKKSVTVAKTNQSINFATISSKTYGDAPTTMSATATSGLPVTFNIISGPASVSGNTMTVNNAGTVVVEATQAGNTTYNAVAVSQTFTVAKAGQTISFPPISAYTLGAAPIILNATASSGFAVSYRVVSGPATIAANVITISNAGTVTIEASQAGNATFNAAPVVSQSFAAATAKVAVAKDVTAPTIITKDVTVQTDAYGQAIIKAADVIASITDISGIDNSSIQVSQTQFTCQTVAAAAPAVTHQAYASDVTNGVQVYGGELGMVFKVNNAAGIKIDALGAFDHQANGITGTQNGGVRVAIFNKATQTIVPGLDAIVAGQADGYNLGHRFKSIQPVILMPGEYVVVAKGYNANELNGNSGMGSPSPFGDLANGAVTVASDAMYGNEGSGFSFPINTDAAKTYLAGTFSFAVQTAATTATTTSATHQAYAASVATGVQDFGGELGMSFNVNNPAGISIDALGAFDHEGNGISGTQNGGVRVAIFNKTTQTIVPGLDAIVAGQADGYNMGHRFKSVKPVILMPGEYVVVAKGYNSLEMNGNSGLGSPLPFGDLANGAITLQTNSFYGTEGSGFSYPTNPDGGKTYLAGTFSFSTITAVQSSNINTVTITAKDIYGNVAQATANVTVLCPQTPASQLRVASASAVIASTQSLQLTKDTVIAPKGNVLHIYPNPTTGRFTVQLSNIKAPQVAIEILSDNGALISKKSVASFGMSTLKIDFDLSNQKSGVYFVKVAGADGIKIGKVVVQH